MAAHLAREGLKALQGSARSVTNLTMLMLFDRIKHCLIGNLSATPSQWIMIHLQIPAQRYLIRATYRNMKLVELLHLSFLLVVTSVRQISMLVRVLFLLLVAID